MPDFILVALLIPECINLIDSLVPRLHPTEKKRNFHFHSSFFFISSKKYFAIHVKVSKAWGLGYFPDAKVSQSEVTASILILILHFHLWTMCEGTMS